jgi:predicted  nucleic acid-binding Zn-ribbon protein
MADLETEVKLLKKELEDQRKIHDRLDIAIEKLTDVSNSIHRMLAVHEEKLTRQEEALESRRVEISSQISELHSRVTTNTKDIMLSATKQHDNQNKEIQKIREDLNKRIGILEKWRHVLIGCSIVAGFILHKFMNFS